MALSDRVARGPVQTERTVVESPTVPENYEPLGSKIARVIAFIINIIVVILAIRFLLTLLGANRANAFADLIYGLSEPFVAPFYGLFNRDFLYGSARIEIEAIFAMIVFGLISWLITRYFVRSKTQTV